MTIDDHDGPTLAHNPGLEHDHATPEGELMTAAGSKLSDGGDEGSRSGGKPRS